MTYQIEAVDKDRYVQITFHGDWPEGEGNRILDDMFASVASSGHTRALVDYREAGIMESGTMMDHEEASYAATLPDIGRFRFAVLFRPEEAERFEFWETVAFNRAIDMKIFAVEAEAVDWLLCRPE